MVHGDVGAQRAELGDLGLDQRPDALFPGLTRAVRMVLKRERDLDEHEVEDQGGQLAGVSHGQTGCRLLAFSWVLNWSTTYSSRPSFALPTQKSTGFVNISTSRMALRATPGCVLSSSASPPSHVE